ncbi:MAG: hypothetical protein K6E97_09345 [Treponema sp.]|nr:hypothetical protein [Treponema sp.]
MKTAVLKKFFIFLFLTLCFSSCKYDLVKSPSSFGKLNKNPADYDDYILPPSALTASHGLSKTVTLSWNKVENAVQYKIYSASTPFEGFESIGETNETTFTTSQAKETPSGLTAWYCVTAVNYYGTESKKSIKVSGSTLDVPVIYEITPNDEGESINLKWWMDNCNSKTYENDIEFIVNTYSDKDGKIPAAGIDSITTDAKTREATVTNLIPKTDYYFQITVKNTKTEDFEKSDLTKEQTAKRIIPQKPINLEVEKGTSKQSVTLSWLLPEPVDYQSDTSTNTSDKHPVFFKVFRKLESQEDSDYVLIKTIGAQGLSNSKAEIHFNCQTETTDNSIITIQKAEEGTALTGSYASYISQSRLTFKDVTVDRTKTYTYKVQSYTDDTNKNFSSDSSASVQNGWALPVPSVLVNATDIVTENVILSVNVTFNISFNDKNIPYNLVLTKKHKSFSSSSFDQEKFLTSLSMNGNPERTVETLLSKATEDEGKWEGYYNFKLYITPKSDLPVSSVPTEYYDSIELNQSVTVVEDASGKPKIKNFTIQDGFKDKFKLSWDSITNGIYIVSWENQYGETGSKQLTTSDYSVSGGKINFTHAAESGDQRLYTLTIKNTEGVSSTKTFETVSKTLGTALPYFNLETIDYKTIRLSWESVQMADTNYVISAKYQGENTELVTSTNTVTTPYNQNTEIYETTITAPDKYNNPLYAGKTIVVTITAKNSSTLDTTTATINTCLLGPANINLQKDLLTYDQSIRISWKKITGAAGYIINRNKYKLDGSTWIFDRADKYFYNAVTQKVYINGDEVSSSRVNIVLSGDDYILKDIYKEPDDSTNSYELNQSQICWGIPFGYTVLPVKNGGNADDFKFGTTAQNYLKIQSDSASEVIYSTSLEDVKNATWGYGVNIKADKSQNSSIQTISWQKPYYESVPQVYTRLCGTTGAWEKITTNLTSSKTNASFKPKSKLDPYEYCIIYNKTDSNITVPPSFTENLSVIKEDRYDYTGKNSEQANKGYLLAIDFDACYGGTPNGSGNYVNDENYYSELVSWASWDYDNRSIGPDEGSEIYIYNANLSACSNDTWIKVATLDRDCKYSSKETLTNTTISTTNTSLSLKPSALANSTKPVTEGPLMVLRDYKHYYKIILKKDGIEPQYTTIDKKEISSGTEKPVYAIRQINDTEFARSVMLEFAYAFYINDGGNPNYSNITNRFKYGGGNTIGGYTGSVIFEARSRATSELGLGKFKQYYTYQNYTPSILNPNGSSTPFLSLTTSKYSAGIKGDADSYIYLFRDNHDIEVSCVEDETANILYTGKVNINVSSLSTMKLVVTRNGNSTTVVDTTDENVRRKFFPMLIVKDDLFCTGDDHYWLIDSSLYWWN